MVIVLPTIEKSPDHPEAVGLRQEPYWCAGDIGHDAAGVGEIALLSRSTMRAKRPWRSAQRECYITQYLPGADDGIWGQEIGQRQIEVTGTRCEGGAGGQRPVGIRPIRRKGIAVA